VRAFIIAVFLGANVGALFLELYKETEIAKEKK